MLKTDYCTYLISLKEEQTMTLLFFNQPIWAPCHVHINMSLYLEVISAKKKKIVDNFDVMEELVENFVMDLISVGSFPVFY